MEDSVIPLNVVIADRSYRIRANSSEEEAIRKTVKFLNDKVVEFKQHFAGKDMQDYLSMVILWYATQQEEQALHKNDALTEETIMKWEKLLDEADV